MQILILKKIVLTIMQNQLITTSSTQTKKLGEMLAQELCGREIICLSGDLGSGKTTFTQGLLKGLGIKGPYTSPTFNIIKEYEGQLTFDNKQLTKKGSKVNLGFQVTSSIM